MFVIAGATESKIPTWIPKKDINTNTVPLTRKLLISSTAMFKRPTTIPNKNTAHNISFW